MDIWRCRSPAMAYVMAWTGPISARHGLCQAPSLRPQGRSRRLSIRLESGNTTLTAEQTQKAIEVQLRRAKGTSGASEEGNGSQSKPEQSADGELKTRQQGARDWITAWQQSQSSAQDSGASMASTAESERVLAELRAGNPLLTKEQEQAAMQRLLNQGTQSIEEDGNGAAGNSQSASEGSSNDAAQDSETGKYAPKVTFDDGSVMYSAADLEAVDYEALL